jgi:hypothetical protein
MEDAFDDFGRSRRRLGEELGGRDDLRQEPIDFWGDDFEMANRRGEFDGAIAELAAN